jgi:hypothetical protein
MLSQDPLTDYIQIPAISPQPLSSNKSRKSNSKISAEPKPMLNVKRQLRLRSQFLPLLFTFPRLKVMFLLMKIGEKPLRRHGYILRESF